ncbi:Rim13p [Sporobolomyces koalae]|uniref:Rim13p n=1 Tax=Sporobolomyces koalae TaxID=500713 RepID=UPI00316FAC6B
MSAYGTRRSSAIQMGAPTAARQPYDPSLSPSASLSSSVGKSKRPTTMSKSRRLSSSTQSQRPASVPVHSHFSRGRSVSVSAPDEDDDGEVTGRARAGKDKSLFECEKCSKVYRHSTCLTKHRWEHTTHWKEASKLLLSKHQQVQLLEGAAILAAASVGTSLPDEKSYWPAAVSPPASGLLGSHDLGINIHALAASSPRFAPSSLISENGDFPSFRSEVSMDDYDSEDDEEGASPATEGLSLTMEEDEPLEDGMFDLDLGADSPSPHLIPLPHINAPTGAAALLGAATRQGHLARHVSPSESDSAASLSSSPASGPFRPPIRSTDSGFEPKGTLADSISQEQWAQKYQEAQAAGTRATKLELAGTYDEAFQNYVQAAQAYLFLIRHTTDGETRQRLRTVSSKLLERAEKIKQARKSTVSPVTRDRLAPEEQDSVLARSSFLDGQRLPRWTEQAAIAATSSNVFRRPSPSREQEAVGCTWKRAHDILPNAHIARAGIDGRSIHQDNISDCSLVAALIIAAEHNARFSSRLGMSCLYPQDSAGWPKPSQSGIYTVRLCVNAIDDSLPVSEAGKLICATTAGQDQLWPALVEKAYLSLSGSYNFHGSNSANDLYTLTGWLPEHISLRERYRSEQTWNRLFNAFRLGKCVLSAGTGKVLGDELEAVGLVPSHNYAVLDLRDANGMREVEIMDPWPEPSGWSNDLRAALPGRHRRNTRTIAWEDIALRFAALHINWDPTVFDYSDSVHLSVGNSSAESVGTSKPARHSTTVRVHLEPSSTASALTSEVWFFVSRHLHSKREEGEYLGLQVTRASQESEGVAARPLVDEASTMTDDPFSIVSGNVHTEKVQEAHALPRQCRMRSVGGISDFDVTISHEGLASEFAFTLCVFSNDQISIRDGPPPPPYTAHFQGSWSGDTAGGNHTCSTFLFNPQYRVTLSSPPKGSTSNGFLEVHAQTARDTPINAKLLLKEGKRVAEFENREVLLGTTAYSYGQQTAQADTLRPGTYTLVVSSFQAGHQGNFDIAVHSSLPLQLAPIPSEGAGMYSRKVDGAWEPHPAGQGQAQQSTPTWKIEVARTTNLRARLQTPEGPIPIAINIYVADRGDGAGKRVATSEPYSDPVCGVTIAPVRLEPNASGYLLVPSTFSPDVHARFTIWIYADSPVQLIEND